MNAQLSCPDLSAFTKDALIVLAQHLPGMSLGDYARKSKAQIREQVESYGESAIAVAYAVCVEEGIFEEIEVPDDDYGNNPVDGEADAPQQQQGEQGADGGDAKGDDEDDAEVAIIPAVPQPEAAKQEEGGDEAENKPKPAAPAQVAGADGADGASQDDDLARRLVEAVRAVVPGAAAGVAEDVRDEIMAAITAYDETIVQPQFSAVGSAIIKAVETLHAAAVPQFEKVYIRPNGDEHKVEGEAHVALDRVVKLASIRTNIMLVGPAGSGKTYLAQQAAEALGYEFGAISCTAGMSESQLLGWLLPIGDSGKFEYVESEFVRLYQNGGIYLLDEVDGADANTLMILNQALANGGFYVPQARRWVKRHPDFVCIAAANTFGHGGDMIYAGREKLDGATLDRFRAGFIIMDYDAKLEAKLIDPEVLAWGRNIREKIKSLRLRRVMSTRAMVEFTKQKQAFGWGASEWETSYYADWTKDELSKVGIAA